MIKQCPTNANPDFDPYKGKGVPKNILWKRDLGIIAQEFSENRPKIFRQIMKQSWIYQETQDCNYYNIINNLIIVKT
jgi:hypothetical protein